MKIEIQPVQEKIEKWIRNYIPEKDLFFLPEKDLPCFKDYLINVLLIPREEFFNHKSYNQIQLVNSYEYWNISKDVAYVVVAPSVWVTSLPENKKEQLFRIQKEMGRGLIYSLSDLTIESSFVKENIIEEENEYYLVLQRALWEKLSFDFKEKLMKEIARQWDDWTGYEFPENGPISLRKFANSFPSESGSNCLSTALFPIMQQDWMILEWVHPNTFIESLKRANYTLTSSQEIKAGDVVVWENADGIIQHASYHIGNQLFFNKDGQTFFNPWKIVDFTDLKENWKRFSLRIYRKNA